MAVQNFIFPNNAGTNGQVLATNGTAGIAQLSWTNGGGGSFSVPYEYDTSNSILAMGTSTNIGGHSNTGFGSKALDSNTSGSGNSAFGSKALDSNMGGSGNSAFGYIALQANTTGSQNSALGEAALYSNTSGSQNSSFGFEALYSNEAGGSNSAFGFRALQFNMTGHSNSALGEAALNLNTNGYENSALGKEALYSNTSGTHNSALGRGALYSNTTGSQNSALGYNADVGSGDLINATAIGTYAKAKASHTMQLGGTNGGGILHPNVGIGNIGGNGNAPSYSLHVGKTQGGSVASIGLDSTSNDAATPVAGSIALYVKRTGSTGSYTYTLYMNAPGGTEVEIGTVTNATG